MKIRNWNIHNIYSYSLGIKAIISFGQLLSGITLFFLNQKFIIKIVSLITQEELTEDPKDIIANYLLSIAKNLSLSAQHFFALYLIIHGLIKLGLIVGLWKGKIWSYPTSIFVFVAFIFYQFYKYTITHSIFFLLLSIFDMIIVYLISREYIFVKNKNHETLV